MTELTDRGLVFVGGNKCATSTDTISVLPSAQGSEITYRADLDMHGVASLAAPAMKLAFEKLADEPRSSCGGAEPALSPLSGAKQRQAGRLEVGEGGTRRRNGNGLAVGVRVRVRVRLVSSGQHQAHPDPHSDHRAPGGDLQHAVGPVAESSGIPLVRSDRASPTPRPVMPGPAATARKKASPTTRRASLPGRCGGVTKGTK